VFHVRPINDWQRTASAKENVPDRPMCQRRRHGASSGVPEREIGASFDRAGVASWGVDITFTKLAGGRYMVSVVREHGPELAPRNGPGHDDYLPHDAVHFLVEAEARLARGVFGQIAAGRNNIFWPVDQAQQRRQARREKKRKTRPDEVGDMTRSETLAGLCQALWEFRAGHRSALPDWHSWVQPDLLESPLVGRIVARLDEFASRWHPLLLNDSVTLTWPLPVRRTMNRQPASGLPRPVATARTAHRRKTHVG
jgi:hypothetical protein